MYSYTQQFKLIKSDILIIIIDDKIIPFKGILELIDWQINGLLSKAIISGIITFDNSDNLMFNTQKKLGINKIIILKNSKDLLNNFYNTLTGINANKFTLLVPNGINLNLKNFFKSLKDKKFDFSNLSSKQTKNERLIYFKEVLYESQSIN